jgi:hypothetical protein
MRIFLYRPSPQVPRPSSKSAVLCYEASQFIINLSKHQMEKSAIDVTWVFLLSLYMALNTLLWSVSYAEVRQDHPRDEAEELVNVALDIIDQSAERWPGTAAASQLYSVLAKACFQIYESKETPTVTPGSSFHTPPSVMDANSPAGSETPIAKPASSQSQQQQQQPIFSINPPFGYVFGGASDSGFAFDNPFHQSHPTFRSNSIFFNPGTDQNGRRLSYFPPDFTQPEHSPLDDTAPSTTSPRQVPSPQEQMPNPLPTPPESLQQGNHCIQTPMALSPNLTIPTPEMSHLSPIALHATPVMNNQTIAISPPQVQKSPAAPQAQQRTPAFTIPPVPQHGTQQRPLPPTTITDWFTPPPPFISPYAFGSMNTGGFYGDPGNQGMAGFGGSGGLGLSMGISSIPGGAFNFAQQRQGSLSQEQQLELMEVLDSQGIGDIDAFLNMGPSMIGGPGIDDGVRWR